MGMGKINNKTKPFDIFISYKSENIDWVNRLKQDLQRRGVKVWLDKEQIRPGDHFAEALEHGIELSKSMGLVITAESLRSNWVREEYYRALSLVNEDSLQLIPIMLEQAELPGFLKGRQYIDFSNESSYERNVDRLVWPGITGKRIVIAWVLPSEVHRYDHHHYCYKHDSLLYKLVQKLGVEVKQVSLDLESSWWHESGDVISMYRPARHLVFVNVLEDDLESHLHCFSPERYIDFIFQLRERTKGTENELGFILQNKRGGLESSKGISAEVLNRLRHYFVIYNDEPEDVINKRLEHIWHEAQRLLLNTETWDIQLPTVTPTYISVYGIYEDGSKYIRKMNLSFIANCLIKETDIKFYIESSTLIIELIGKSIELFQSKWDFFKVSRSGNRLILVPTGLNGVWLDSKSSIKAEMAFDIGVTRSNNIKVHLEFFRP